MSDLRQDRINRGLCPQCGKEAAPYYLCPDCRQLRSLGGMLNRMNKHDVVRKSKKGRFNLWFTGARTLEDAGGMKNRSYPLWNEGKGADDKRLRPRIGKIPVDVERELLEMLSRFDRPVSEDEIVQAWGRMRVRRGRASAAGDLVALIKAERRRVRRCEKRLKWSRAA